MKNRKCFVANSSSSSFILIDTCGPANILKNEYTDRIFVIGEYGRTEFGWEWTEEYDVYAKINFAFLQAMSGGVRPDWKEMLFKVVKEHTGASEVKSIIKSYWDDDENECDGERKVTGYIDHQSAASEGENTEIFESEEALIAFLFCGCSYIRTGNDNDSEPY